MLTPIVSRAEQPEIHRARWLAADSDTLVENGCVQIHNGIISHVGPFRPDLEGQVHDHGPGLLMPALVNAHTHLELSALKGKLPADGGFEHWVRTLLELRESAGQEALIQGVHAGKDELTGSGTLVVGDVSTLGIVAESLRSGVLSGVLFREYLGNTIPSFDSDADHGPMVCSLAGHAPHTSSPDLLVALKKQCRSRNLPLSIHLCESDDEMEFITQGKGNWAEFLMYRGIDFSGWGIPAPSPVKHLDRLGLLDDQTLCVHVIRADDRDLDLLRQAQSPVCLCPRSNVRLHRLLPPVENMLAKGLLLCLGTDSLASTPSLSIVDEMAFLAGQVPGLSPRTLFRMATENGARALGLGNAFGRLEPGMSGTLCYADVPLATKQTLFESIYHD